MISWSVTDRGPEAEGGGAGWCEEACSEEGAHVRWRHAAGAAWGETQGDHGPESQPQAGEEGDQRGGELIVTVTTPWVILGGLWMTQHLSSLSVSDLFLCPLFVLWWGRLQMALATGAKTLKTKLTGRRCLRPLKFVTETLKLNIFLNNSSPTFCCSSVPSLSCSMHVPSRCQQRVCWPLPVSGESFSC